MFNRNAPAHPQINWGREPATGEVLPVIEGGLTKFEQCAKDFTAAWIDALASRANAYDQGELDGVVQDATLYGLKQAEEFCKQMEEREK
jgi:hypothetical protein